MAKSAKEMVLEKLNSRYFLRSCELEEAGANRALLGRMVSRGEIEKVGTGVYALPGREISEHENLIEVAVRAPKSVFCLLTALSIHEVTTQMPREIWVALEEGDRIPKFTYPPTKKLKFSSSSFQYGIETKSFEGREVRVYSVSKTVADCFKFRNRIGVDVAIEAMKDSLRKRLVTFSSLLEASRVNSVEKVITPYLEAMM